MCLCLRLCLCHCGDGTTHGKIPLLIEGLQGLHGAAELRESPCMMQQQQAAGMTGTAAVASLQGSQLVEAWLRVGPTGCAAGLACSSAGAESPLLLGPQLPQAWSRAFSG